MSETDVHSITVSYLTEHIKAVVEETFPSMWVVGEISGLSRPRSGHVYFTLKDEAAQIRCVMWRSTAQRIRTELSDGQEVVCLGDLEVYAARGSYQLVVRNIRAQGVGALQQAYLQLRSKLESEGLFAAERKRALPTMPRRVGVVTSPSGAAIRDFLKAASNRWRGAQIIVVPTEVQGPGSAGSIATAIRKANRIHPPLDVLVVTRGGGSMEDLWSFNEEDVVRAIANSDIPTVCGVGHEVDVTLSDLAADVRALTPTDAATQAIPDGESFHASLHNLTARMHRSMRSLLEIRTARLQYCASRPVFARPLELLNLQSRRLDELEASATRAMKARIDLNKHRIAKAAASLSALSPLSVLTRGYSVTLDEDGKAIESAKQVAVGDTVRTRLNNGRLESKVTRVQMDSDGETNAP